MKRNADTTPTVYVVDDDDGGVFAEELFEGGDRVADADDGDVTRHAFRDERIGRAFARAEERHQVALGHNPDQHAARRDRQLRDAFLAHRVDDFVDRVGIGRRHQRRPARFGGEQRRSLLASCFAIRECRLPSASRCPYS